MDEASITQYITGTFAGVELVAASCDAFFFYDPDRTIPSDHRFPFATLVTGDRYDQVSNLNRPGVFRLNIGIGRQTYQSLFGAQTASPDAAEASSHDFAALDKIMPHPVYASMHWVCVLNPGAATWRVVQALLAEAHERAARKHVKTPRTDES